MVSSTVDIERQIDENLLQQREAALCYSGFHLYALLSLRYNEPVL